MDLAKSVFQVHGVDSHEQVKVRKQLTALGQSQRSQMLDFFRQVEVPCVVAMEACGSAHYWGRELSKLGHEVRLISPQFVKPYVKSGKNDANDAEAICEAASRPTMRFVAVKTTEQQVALGQPPGKRFTESEAGSSNRGPPWSTRYVVCSASLV